MSIPTHQLELQLLARMLDGEKPRHAGDALGIPPKRVWAWCHKWIDRGWYDFGVSLDIGWLNDDRKDEIRSWIEARAKP